MNCKTHATLLFDSCSPLLYLVPYQPKDGTFGMETKSACTTLMQMPAIMELELVFIKIYVHPLYGILKNVLCYRCHCISCSSNTFSWGVYVSSDVFSENTSSLCSGGSWILRFHYFSTIKCTIIFIKNSETSILAFWSFLYAVGFIYLASQWTKTLETPDSVASGNNMRAAIAFSFFSVFTWVSGKTTGKKLQCITYS